jgi:hypothetical protein
VTCKRRLGTLTRHPSLVTSSTQSALLKAERKCRKLALHDWTAIRAGIGKHVSPHGTRSVLGMAVQCRLTVSIEVSRNLSPPPQSLPLFTSSRPPHTFLAVAFGGLTRAHRKGA